MNTLSHSGFPGTDPNRSARILIIDDDEIVAAVVEQELNVAGYSNVAATTDPRQGLALAESQPPDLILLDLLIPEMNGLEVLAALRAKVATAVIPVIVLTASRDDDFIVKAIELGANDVLNKPVRPPLLVARVKNVLAAKAHRDYLEEYSQNLERSVRQRTREYQEIAMQFRALAANIPGAAYRRPRDATYPFAFLADGARELTGYPIADFLSHPPRDWYSLIHPEDLVATRTAMDAALDEQRPFHVEYRMVRADGRILHVCERGQGGVAGAAGSEIAYIDGVVFDISERKALESNLHQDLEHLGRMANTDPLTGLANRAGILTRLALLARRPAAEKANWIGVLFIDLDRFKHVNDLRGHETGDALIKSVAQRISDVVRGGDSLVGRLGGDEFVVALADLKSEHEALAAAERILATLQRTETIGGATVSIGASIGVAVGNACQESPSDLLRNANAAMFTAKRLGRGRCVLFDQSMRDRKIHRSGLERDLRAALDGDELFLEYQPIVSLADGQLHGVEALLRWVHPQFGRMNPSEFIPLAEESDLIVDLGAWVIHRAIAQLSHWDRRKDFSAPPIMSVNLARRQFARKGLATELREALDAAGIAAGRIQLEITEETYAADVATSLGTMHELRRNGIRLAIDDFGAGTASLSTIRQMPIDLLKIDRSVVAQLDRSPDAAALVQSLAILARSMGTDLAGEGVETTQQAATLQEMGCRLGQGYLFARPQGGVELEASFARATAIGAEIAVPTSFGRSWHDPLGNPCVATEL